MFSKLNPFNLSNEQLLNYSMDDNKNDYEETTPLQSINTTLQNNYSFYDPYAELDREEVEDNLGAHVTSFYERLNYQKPRFSKDETTENIIRDLNVREIQNAFDAEQNMLNTVTNLFSPITGNTEAERAKSQEVQKLLDEIRSFSIQYNLTKTQTEFLQNQVLSNHLGEYLTRKKQIEEQDKKTEKETQIATAGGVDTEPQTDDAVRDADEQEAKVRDEGDGVGDLAHGGAHENAGVAEEAKEEQAQAGAGGVPRTPDQPIGGGVAGAEGGDLEGRERETPTPPQSTSKQRQDGRILYDKLKNAYDTLKQARGVPSGASAGEVSRMAFDIRETISLVADRSLSTLHNYVTRQGGSNGSEYTQKVVRALVYINTDTDINERGRGAEYKVNVVEQATLKNEITDLKAYVDTTTLEKRMADFQP